jgi:NTE family protein
LALGGGFARGIAHLGVLRCLQQHGVPIDCIAGTSAGALAGVAFGSGLPFEQIVKEASAIRFGNFGQWRFSHMGLASNRRLESFPRDHFGVTDFKDLKIPLAIAATDLVDGKAIYYTSGPVGPPLRASCAYPGLFQPVEYDGKLLVDGFVAAAVPVDGARLLGAQVVIAVFLEAERMDRPKSIVDVIGRSFSIVRLQADAGWRAKADVVITPSVHEFAWDDFARTSDLVAAGEQAALEAMPRIQAILQPSSDQARLSPSAGAA